MIRYVLAFFLPILCVGLVLFADSRQLPTQQIPAAYGPVADVGDIFNWR
jgi:hypothetical protein